MNGTIDSLRDLESQLGALVSGAFAVTSVRSMSDDDVVALLDVAAAIGRRAEAMIAEAAGEVWHRSDAPTVNERMSSRYGCRNARELVQRVTRVSGRVSGDFLKAGRATAVTTSFATGEELPAEYPAMREALADGVVGADGLLAVAGVLDGAIIPREQRDAADLELAASARGAGADGGGLPTADELRCQAHVWRMYLDPDGAEPREERAQRKRGMTLGVCRDGVVPVRGNLLPEVAGQLQRIWDSILNPNVADIDAASGPRFVEDEEHEDAPLDFRTRAQKQHDALATVLSTAARSGELPTIGGATPTLLVSTRHEDLVSGAGFAHVDGIDEPVSLAVARQVACTGGVQRVVFDAAGRIERIEIPDRVFGPHQRRAITLRDGACIIPGCHVPAAWCEIHHVHEHARGGGTHTDNGVLLCWHHHRTLDTSGWKIRMRRGVPEVRGPSWWDAFGTWRPVTKSPTRIRDRFAAMRQ